MTKFIHIDPVATTVKVVEAEDWRDIVPNIGNVDHGMVTPAVGIFVYEYGLLEGNGPYFALGGQLFSGEAVLFGSDEAGETIDLPTPPRLPIWLKDKRAVEAAIAAGIVERPTSAINGEITWSWSWS